MNASSAIPSPACWRGQEICRRPEWNHRFDSSEVDELLSLVSGFKFLSSAGTSWQGRPLEETGAEHFVIPRIADRLARMQGQLEEGAGVVRLQGFPLQQLSEAEARALYWVLSVHLGTPVSQSASGEKIFSVRDEGYQENDARARGPNTRKRLSFHTDRCDVIGFLCLKAARAGGENEIVSSVSVYQELLQRRPDLVDVLSQPFHYLRHTVDEGNPRPWCRQPVFSFCEGHFACCFLRVLIERAARHPDLPDLTPRQVEALDALEAIAGDPAMHYPFKQEPGDIIFLNNWTTLHRRREFEDFEEPERKRHILRVWVSPPNNRPLDPLFLDNYGAVSAGSVRGGMRAMS